MLFDKYSVELTLIRDMLGTNPIDPNILDTHIIDRQRKIILEKSQINSKINKYLQQIPISKEKGQEELNRLLDNLSKLIGIEFTTKQRELAIAGELDLLRETFKELELKGTTVFYWDKLKDRPCIGDHMIYGFLKAAAEAIIRTKKSTKKDDTVESEKGKMLDSFASANRIINQHIRCESQFITFDQDIVRNEDGYPVYRQRSLRAMTAQGPRISLAKSEVVEAGTKLGFVIKVLKDSPCTEELLKTLFEYGEISGLGQWRNSGHGQFKAVVSKIV